MKFQLISDIHLEFGKKYHIPVKAPYLLLAGDIGYPSGSMTYRPKSESNAYLEFMEYISTKFEKVFFVAGNHEFYCCEKEVTPLGIRSKIEDKIKEMEELSNRIPNLHFLNNSYYDLDDIRIVGSTLWSNIDPDAPFINDQNQLRGIDTVQLHRENVDYLKKVIEESERKVLVMTHHLPSYEMILEKYRTDMWKKYNSHFASNLDHLFKKPLVGWVCGHSHGFLQKQINGIPCYMNAYGYPKEKCEGVSLEFTFEV